MIPSKSTIMISDSFRQKLMIKYEIDRFIAFGLLILLSPLFLGIALMIKWDGWRHKENAGPVFFSEPRISEGRLFQILKFRTATVKELEWIRKGPGVRSLSCAKQKTNAGKFMLKWYLDELPQLVNIIRGEMCFVGPRPDIVKFYEREKMPDLYYWKILKGGLIGINQACKNDSEREVYFREQARQLIPDEFKTGYLDTYYFERMKNSSLVEMISLDCSIWRMTLETVFKGEGFKFT